MFDLVAHGRAPALIVGDQTLTYADLTAMVDQVARLLHHERKALVFCAGDRDLPTVLAYLAAQRLGHAVMFLPDTPETVTAYRPEFVVPAPDGGADLAELGYEPSMCDRTGVRVFRRRGTMRAPDIFPETAVLLGTSGSTGSPKAVRLSRAGVGANTAAIVRALGITAADRAATTLPITHSYGLSVLNTHLHVGASIVLTTKPPLSLALWDELGRTGVTSFAAVPTTYAALGPAHLNLLRRTKIRTMTQSGARLGDEVTLRLWRAMAALDGRFFVMYGQTEATARMAYLDPAHLPDRVGSVGVAVPGGEITVRPTATHHRALPGEGQVCYRGPGVMLGYARDRDDLTRAAEVSTLDTGDLGYLRDGFLYLTGRTKRIVKVLGIRTSLDDLERMVEVPDQPTAVVADTADVVHLVGAGDPAIHEKQRRLLVESLGVPDRYVVFRPVERLPRTPSGKIDYRRLAAVAAGGAAT